MKAKTSMLGIALAATMVTTANAQLRPRVSPNRDIRGYQPPIAPPLVATFCGRRKECARDGRCTQVGQECVATSMEVCAFSEGCRDDGRCFLDPEAQRCDDGRRRASEGGLAIGTVTTVVGGMAFVAGIGILLSSFRCEGFYFYCGLGGPLAELGGGLLVAGSTTALGVGLPILLVSRKKEWRPDLVVGASIGPTGASLEVSF